jgi:flavin reductase
MSTAVAAPGTPLGGLHRLVSPVTVLTVAHRSRTYGTTVSTVSQVSHRPLLLGAGLHAGAVFAALAQAEGRFSVSVLDGRQGTIARRFGDDPGSHDGLTQFAGVAWHPDPYSAAPLIDGALAHYACRLSACFAVGDHEVLLGRVVRVDGGAGEPLFRYAGDLATGPLRPVTATESGAPDSDTKERTPL